MPRTVSFPLPSSTRCPVCDTGLTRPSCLACGAELSGPSGTRLWQVDHHLHRLVEERSGLVRDVLASRPPTAVAAVPAPTVAPTPPRLPAPGPVATPGSGPSVPEVLVGLGGLSLVAAVVVFAAVTWTDLDAWAQGGLLLAATAATLGAAISGRRRDLRATAEALSAVTVTLAAADVHVARVALDAVASPRAVWAAGLALVAAGAVWIGRRADLRTLVIAGAALSFIPVPLLAQGASSGSILATALVAQALAAVVVADILGDRRLERAVVQGAAVVSWVLAAGGTVLLAGAGLADDPPQLPLGSAALLAALALGSIVIGRRHHSPLLSVAGTALAFAPPLVVAVGTGAVLPVLWVLAAEGVGATVLARRLPVAAGERAVLDVGGLGAWAAAAMAGAALGVADLVDRPDVVPTGAVAVLVVLAGASILLGRAVRSPGLAAAGVGLAFVPAVLVAAGAGTPTAVLGVLAVEAAVGLALSASLDRLASTTPGADPVGLVARAGAVTTWLVTAIGATVLGGGSLILADSSPTTSVGAVALLLVLTAEAVAAALWARWDRDATGAALVAATTTLLGGVALAQGAQSADVAVTTVALAAGAVALGASPLVRLDRDRPWTAPLVAAGSTVAALALIPLQSVITMLAALADVSTPPSAGNVGQSLVGRLSSSNLALDGVLPTASTLLQLVSVALLGGALLLLGRRAGVAVLTAAGVALAVVAPVVADLSIGATAMGLALLVVTGAVVLVGRPDHPTALGAQAVLVPVLLAVSVASTPVAIAATVLVTAMAAALALLALRSAATSAPLWVGGALVILLGGVVLDSLLLGASGSVPALALAATAVAISAAAPAIERWTRPDQDDGSVVVADVVVAGALVVALLASRSIDAASAVIGAIALVAGLASLRPTRRSLWLVSLTAVVILTWMRLAVASVELVEAYTLPLAGALLAVGLLVRRGAPRTSWERVGAALVAGLAPTAYLALTEPDPARTVAVVIAGVAVTLWGASEKEQAPLALGGAAVAAVALRHLGPVAAELPRWTVLAAAGIVLLAAGATFEQRRRDLRLARDAFSRLR